MPVKPNSGSDSQCFFGIIIVILRTVKVIRFPSFQQLFKDFSKHLYSDERCDLTKQ